MDSEKIHQFWFGQLLDPGVIPARSTFWFQPSEAFDKEIRENFANILENAAQGKCDSWKATPQGMLSLIILFDQFPRNMFRGTARAFAYDRFAVEVAKSLTTSGLDKKLFPIERTFAYLPFEHAEDLAVQYESERLFAELSKECPDKVREYFEDNLRYAVRHREIIERFGRFPHRNSILGRKSTPEEIAFLKEPMSSF